MNRRTRVVLISWSEFFDINISDCLSSVFLLSFELSLCLLRIDSGTSRTRPASIIDELATGWPLSLMMYTWPLVEAGASPQPRASTEREDKRLSYSLWTSLGVPATMVEVERLGVSVFVMVALWPPSQSCFRYSCPGMPNSTRLRTPSTKSQKY